MTEVCVCVCKKRERICRNLMRGKPRMKSHTGQCCTVAEACGSGPFPLCVWGLQNPLHRTTGEREIYSKRKKEKQGNEEQCFPQLAFLFIAFMMKGICNTRLYSCTVLSSAELSVSRGSSMGTAYYRGVCCRLGC